MARTISASVGRMGGRSLPADTVTVQQLLNQVAAGQGNPVPLLEVDGLCGPKTIDAIQRFQLQHFGWSGADGRVDPAGQTLARLNTFDGQGPRRPDPVTVETKMRCGHGGTVLAKSRRGTLVLTAGDEFKVTACAQAFSPCATVRWMSPPNKALSKGDQGMSFNQAGVVQGLVRFV